MANFFGMTGCSLIITTYNWPEALELCLKSVLAQNRIPDEVIVGDDGSGEETKKLIDRYKEIFPVPLKHCWIPDEGYRINVVRNKAIESAAFPYIIQIDGDVILEENFVKDHLTFAKKGRLIVGRRVGIDEEQTRHFLLNKAYQNLSSLRNKHIALFHDIMLYNRKSIRGLCGCNVSFWRDDAYVVNGYDEDMKSKGPNDKEFGLRLLHAGVDTFNMKFFGIQFHLHHNEGNLRSNYSHVKGIYDETLRTKKIKCLNGLEKK